MSKLSPRIILIGGGEITKRETLAIDKEFIRLSGGKKAVIGFFPTAADDSEGYMKTFTSYIKTLGCQNVVPAKLSKSTPEESTKLIRKMSGIYLGGGATKTLIRIFKEKGTNREIKKALRRGVVLAGMSAGALAACDYYIDPDTETEKQEIEEGLGFQHKVLCVVHYQQNRAKDKLALSCLQKRFPDYEVVGIKEKRAILISGEAVKWLG